MTYSENKFSIARYTLKIFIFEIKPSINNILIGENYAKRDFAQADILCYICILIIIVMMIYHSYMIYWPINNNKFYVL